jgi:hypothetical protein
MRPQSSTIIAASPTTSAETRIGAYNWEALGNELDSYGCAVLPNLLSREECRATAALYREESYFRHVARLASPAIRDAATVRFIGRRLQRQTHGLGDGGRGLAPTVAAQAVG